MADNILKFHPCAAPPPISISIPTPTPPVCKYNLSYEIDHRTGRVTSWEFTGDNGSIYPPDKETLTLHLNGMLMSLAQTPPFTVY